MATTPTVEYAGGFAVGSQNVASAVEPPGRYRAGKLKYSKLLRLPMLSGLLLVPSMYCMLSTPVVLGTPACGSNASEYMMLCTGVDDAATRGGTLVKPTPEESTGAVALEPDAQRETAMLMDVEDTSTVLLALPALHVPALVASPVAKMDTTAFTLLAMAVTPAVEGAATMLDRDAATALATGAVTVGEVDTAASTFSAVCASASGREVVLDTRLAVAAAQAATPVALKLVADVAVSSKLSVDDTTAGGSVAAVVLVETVMPPPCAGGTPIRSAMQSAKLSAVAELTFAAVVFTDVVSVDRSEMR